MPGWTWCLEHSFHTNIGDSEIPLPPWFLIVFNKGALPLATPPSPSNCVNFVSFYLPSGNLLPALCLQKWIFIKHHSMWGILSRVLCEFSLNILNGLMRWTMWLPPQHADEQTDPRGPLPEVRWLWEADWANILGGWLQGTCHYSLWWTASYNNPLFIYYVRAEFRNFKNYLKAVKNYPLKFICLKNFFRREV